MPSFEVNYEEGLAYYDDAYNNAEQEIVDMGLPLTRRPCDRNGEFADRPELPPRLDACGWSNLQNLLGQFTAWFSYANEQLPAAMGRRNAAESKRSFAWSKIRKSQKGTVADKDDATKTDKRYIKVAAEYEQCDTVVRLLRHIVEGLQREIETVSRIGTLESNAQNVEGRGNTMENQMRRASGKQQGTGNILGMFKSDRRKGRGR